MDCSSLDVPIESAEELFENAPCGYLSSAADGTILRVNQTLLDWLGYRRDDLVGRRRLVDLLTTSGQVFHEAHYAPLLQTQGFAREIALDLVTRAGERVPTLLNSRLVRDRAGAPWYVRTSLCNASDRRRCERELLLERRNAGQAAKVKAEFLATASHGIRNQLHAIAALSQLFLARPGGADYDRYQRMLETSCSDLLSLVNDVLDYSKFEAGKLALDERPFNVRDAVHTVVTSVRARAELSGLTLRAEIDERIPPLLSGDAIKIAQVLINLCSNALKFTERGTVTISVRLREHGPHSATLLFQVIDTGIGIPLAHLASISEAFSQHDREPGANAHSSGLGLPICQRLLALQGSSLRVESGLGQGCTFSFELRLPVVTVPEARDLLSDIMAKHTLRGVRVLVALHEQARLSGDALQLTQLLTRWGAEFELVESSERVIDRVQHGPYDLVLMDTELDCCDGWRCTRSIRELPCAEPATVPIIALGSSVEPGQRAQLARAGFTDFLSKPFQPDLLFRSIALHACIHRAARAETPPRGPRWSA